MCSELQKIRLSKYCVRALRGDEHDPSRFFGVVSQDYLNMVSAMTVFCVLICYFDADSLTKLFYIASRDLFSFVVNWGLKRKSKTKRC